MEEEAVKTTTTEEGDTSESAAAADETKTDSTEGESSTESGSSDSYYEAELAKLREERDNYKQAVLNENDKKRKQAEAETRSQNSAFDAEDIAEIVRTEIRENTKSLQENILKDTISDVLDSLASTDAEKKLILEHYHNTIQKSGVSRSDIQRDMRRAYVLANENRLVKDAKEKAIAGKSKEARQAEVAGEPVTKASQTKKLSSADQRFLERMGVSADKIK